MAKDNPLLARQKRHVRVRAKVKGTAEKPRLAVFRSLNYIYAQVVDDTRGQTLAAASSLEPDIKALDGKKKTELSGLVGSLVAKRTIERGIKEVAFDRGGYKYHGRVKALAEAARKEGLNF